MKKVKKITILRLQDLIIYFFVCSFIGWVLEVAYAFSVFGTFVDRGFLNGPICPIYGCGAVAMVLLTNFIKKKDIKNTINMFLIVMIIATIIEYIASLLLEKIFNLRWWDYSGYFLNINGRVCLLFSIFFGIAGVIFIKKIYNPIQMGINKVRKRLSVNVIWSILITFTVIIVVDIGFSYVKYKAPELKNVDLRVVIQNNAGDK